MEGTTWWEQILWQLHCQEHQPWRAERPLGKHICCELVDLNLIVLESTSSTVYRLLFEKYWTHPSCSYLQHHDCGHGGHGYGHDLQIFHFQSMWSDKTKCYFVVNETRERKKLCHDSLLNLRNSLLLRIFISQVSQMWMGRSKTKKFDNRWLLVSRLKEEPVTCWCRGYDHDYCHARGRDKARPGWPPNPSCPPTGSAWGRG